MNSKEFLDRYARGTKTTSERMLSRGLFAAPCTCGHSSCYGWQISSMYDVDGREYVHEVCDLICNLVRCDHADTRDIVKRLRDVIIHED